VKADGLSINSHEYAIGVSAAVDESAVRGSAEVEVAAGKGDCGIFRRDIESDWLGFAGFEKIVAGISGDERVLPAREVVERAGGGAVLQCEWA